MIYYLNLIILSFNSIGERIINSKFFIYLDVFILSTFAGFRSYSVGPDTIRYFGDYQSIFSGFGSIMNFEKGYVLFENIGRIFRISLPFFFFLIAFITILILMLGFREFTPYISSAFLYYYCRYFLNREMNQVRSALVAALILFSLRYVTKKSFLKFALIIIIASFIHKAAIVSLLIYPCNIFFWRKNNKKKILFIYVVTLIIAVILSFEMSGVLSSIFSFLDEGNSYIDSTNANGARTMGLMNPVIFLQVIISVLSIIGLSDDVRLRTSITTYMISTFLIILLSNHYLLAGRLSTLLATVEPILVLKLSKKYIPNKILSLSLFLIFSFIVFYLVYVKSGLLINNYLPYSFNF